MPLELIHAASGWELTRRERAILDDLLGACVRTLRRRLPEGLVLVELEVELARAIEVGSADDGAAA